MNSSNFIDLTKSDEIFIKDIINLNIEVKKKRTAAIRDGSLNSEWQYMIGKLLNDIKIKTLARCGKFVLNKEIETYPQLFYLPNGIHISSLNRSIQSLKAYMKFATLVDSNEKNIRSPSAEQVHNWRQNKKNKITHQNTETMEENTETMEENTETMEENTETMEENTETMEENTETSYFDDLECALILASLSNVIE
jgi:hypothetical protein